MHTGGLHHVQEVPSERGRSEGQTVRSKDGKMVDEFEDSQTVNRP